MFLHMLACLKSSDYTASEWCVVRGGGLYPYDVYQMQYDCERRVRNVCGLEVYMKFSVSEMGQLNLAMVSCHGSR